MLPFRGLHLSPLAFCPMQLQNLASVLRGRLAMSLRPLKSPILSFQPYMNASSSGFLSPGSGPLLGQAGFSALATLRIGRCSQGKGGLDRSAHHCPWGPVNQSCSPSRSMSPQSHALKENSALLFRDFSICLPLLSLCTASEFSKCLEEETSHLLKPFKSPVFVTSGLHSHHSLCCFLRPSMGLCWNQVRLLSP